MLGSKLQYCSNCRLMVQKIMQGGKEVKKGRKLDSRVQQQFWYNNTTQGTIRAAQRSSHCEGPYYLYQPIRPFGMADPELKNYIRQNCKNMRGLNDSSRQCHLLCAVKKMATHYLQQSETKIFVTLLTPFTVLHLHRGFFRF